ncbi:GNAT family N-acetyltransferase [Alkalicoccus luteus]|uniref:GNAT family N-acetyltransferase n=1 Tax=Alkalicoccus luteus TaxID=1237094 RepID=A0A969TTG5_9BACI|nr:GNAT family N-acetyltransferase [Alkalicoccus luteus]NJP36235.1 GNAT family N-acetyltransferase [Alkalicoccus luteus]
MIHVKRAELEHVEGIQRVCCEGCRAAYRGLQEDAYIERNNRYWYNETRIKDELKESDRWDGYYVAIENGEVVGAIGGGLMGEAESEVYVLYLDPARRGEGIGTMLLETLTHVQQLKGSQRQWVSVAKGNQKGIPFYESRGFQFVAEKPSFSNQDGEDYRSFRYVREIGGNT